MALPACAFAETANKHGVTLTIPTGWELNTRMSDQGPLILDNFSAEYLRGGLVPMGGADISVSRKPLPEGTLDEIVELATRRDRYYRKTAETVGGKAAIRVYYGAEIWPDYEESDVAVFVAGIRHLYRFQLVYNSRDTASAAHLATFDAVLRSVRFEE